VTQPKVLLLERSDATRGAMRELLESENCDVVSPGSLTEGLSQISARCFDVLVINLGTQRVTDYPAIAAALRMFQPECPLVAVSDSFNKRETELAIRIQADYIVSPENVREVARDLHAKHSRLKITTKLDTKSPPSRIATSAP
jgi:DNA-binding response OmpR family regulator